MLGPPKARHVDRPVRISLEDLVPPGHFYRHLEQVLDLRFVRELVRDRYAPGGRPSLDPVVYFKLQLILFFEGLRSERKLVETASLNLAHRWYLGYALDEPLPDHSTLTKLRQRLGVAVFRRFFERVVELCQAAGLVWGQELFFDATRVRANAGVTPSCPASDGWSGTTSRPSSPRAATRATGRMLAPPPGPPSRLRPPSSLRPRGRSRRRRRPAPPGAAAVGARGAAVGRARPGPPGSGAPAGLRLPAALSRARQPHRPGRHPHEHRQWRAGRPGLPDALRRRRGPRPDHPPRPDDPRRRAREPADARPAPAGALPVAGAPQAGRRRLQVRDGREHPGARGRGDPGLLPVGRHRPPPGPPTTRRRPSPSTPRGTSTAAPRATPCGATGWRGSASWWGTSPTPPSATPARSRPRARPERPVATSTARSTRRTSTACGRTTGPRPTRRRCASAASGSRRCSERPSSGTACASSASAASRR